MPQLELVVPLDCPGTPQKVANALEIRLSVVGPLWKLNYLIGNGMIVSSLTMQEAALQPSTARSSFDRGKKQQSRRKYVSQAAEAWHGMAGGWVEFGCLILLPHPTLLVASTAAYTGKFKWTGSYRPGHPFLLTGCRSNLLGCCTYLICKCFHFMHLQISCLD